MKQKVLFTMALCAMLGFANSCKKDSSSDDSGGGGAWYNFFSLEDDKKLGQQTRDEIAKDPVKYPLLDETQYAEAYTYIRKITDKVINSGKLDHRNDFDWQVKIIRDDAVLNAFCAPGGYMYVYTGLIKYLDNEAQLAGVMGHEIAHADQRHSTDALSVQYGVQMLLDYTLGKDPGLAAQIASNLLSLKYSRGNESDADNHSVIYLYPTDYNAYGARGFFQKLEDEGKGNDGFGFLSTHPNPEDRITHITQKWQSLGGKTGNDFQSEYATFKTKLP